MIQLTNNQSAALQKLRNFSEEGGSRCFVLRGYAGTGKTTLVGYYVDWLEQHGFEPVLLATTGRAAKVLATKTGRAATTIHGCVYVFNEMEEQLPQADQSGQLTLQFGVRDQPYYLKPVVYIVDEASMIANTASKGGQMARFGSGHLLRDFLSFSEGQRVVFVGDPCQLPPVSNDLFSPALSPRYLRDQYQVAVRYAELFEIVRQEEQSEILQLAGVFRHDIVKENYIKWPKLSVPREQAVHLMKNEHLLVAKYMEYLRRKEYDQAVMIVNANRHCRRLNHKIRMTLFNHKDLRKGELLMVVQNSHLVPLSNGDQVVLESIQPHGKKAGFFFLEVKVRSIANGVIYQTLLIRDLLFNDYAGLQTEESKRLLIDFDKRMRNKGLSRKSEKYQEAMRTDPYLNALRAKFGYVITCHKSQGGEWPNVFLNIQKGVYALPSNALYRWFYTALTRASQKLYINDGFWIKGFAKRQPKVNAAFFKKRRKG